MPLLWIVFFVTPLVEMYILIKVGGIIGAWPTIGLVVLTATIGLAMLRHEGAMTLRRVAEATERGELPADEVLGGLLLFIGGALLLTPGFMTDAIGFALLLRPSRLAIARALRARFFHVAEYTLRRSRGRRRDDDPIVIDGEFTRRDD